MRRRRLPLCLLLFALGLPAQQRLRVLSYNIHHGEGVDGKLDLPRIAAVIRSVSPDFAALQEVDIGTRRTGGVDQSIELARLTGMHVLFGRTIWHEGGRYGNALLSRIPAAGFVNHAFPNMPKREPRAAIDTAFELTDSGEALRFLATHLDITRPDRLTAAARLNEIAASYPASTPMILAGDLNDTPDSPVLELLRKQWTPASLGHVLLTIPVKEPARQIDYILFRPASRWRVIEVRVLEEFVASDHRAIFAVLELLSAP